MLRKLRLLALLLILGIILNISLFTSATSASIADGLVAYYSFNGNAYDMSGNGNHGIVLGASLTEDRFGNPHSAFNFSGDSNCYIFSNIEILPLGNSERTLCVWAKSADGQRLGMLITL